MKEKILKFMEGRYGGDELSRFGMVLAIILTILSGFFRKPWLNTIAFFFVLYFGIFRVFSKNTTKRYGERLKYLNATEPLRKFFRQQSLKIKNKSKYKYLKCPKCSKKMKVPKGKGKIKITCPYCKENFIKKT
ncbi:MAG: hypothetical protein Q4P28_02690 [Tissierellia bacterium]|nr:hypothetical protein [Tissierellia bacterium]